MPLSMPKKKVRRRKCRSKEVLVSMETLTERRLAEIRDAIIEQNAILESIRDSILDLPEKIIKASVSDDYEGWWED